MPSDRSYEELGERLRSLRTARGWSLRKAAKAIGGISHSRLQDFERGRDPHSAIPTRPTEEQIMRIAKVYEVDQRGLLRLAGYSTVGPLTQEEEEVILRLRRIERQEAYEQALEYIERLEEQ